MAVQLERLALVKVIMTARPGTIAVQKYQVKGGALRAAVKRARGGPLVGL